jgi:hypothetical protein
MVAVWVLISDSSSLTHWGVWVKTKTSVHPLRSCGQRTWLTLLVLALASD